MDHVVVRAGALPAHAQRLERLEHARDVVGVQQVMDVGVTLGERREQQHAIGDALAARQPRAALGAPRRWQIEEGAHSSEPPPLASLT